MTFSRTTLMRIILSTMQYPVYFVTLLSVDITTILIMNLLITTLLITTLLIMTILIRLNMLHYYM
jgi:hypothetical protein